MANNRRWIALLLVVALSALYGALVALAGRHAPTDVLDAVWRRLADPVAALTEPAALALAGCLWLAIGVAVGMVRQRSALQSTE